MYNRVYKFFRLYTVCVLSKRKALFAPPFLFRGSSPQTSELVSFGPALLQMLAQGPFVCRAMNPEEHHPPPNNVLTDSEDELSSLPGSDSSDTQSIEGHGVDHRAPEVDHPPPNDSV